jgi:hypothetical protein
MAVEYEIREGRRIEVETLESSVAPKRQRAGLHIGCPLEWLKQILPLVKTKDQLAVALWLHRRRAVCRNTLFSVPNQKLYQELGLSRKVKYQTLRRLEKAKVVALVRANKRSLQVRILK